MVTQRTAYIRELEEKVERLQQHFDAQPKRIEAAVEKVRAELGRRERILQTAIAKELVKVGKVTFVDEDGEPVELVMATRRLMDLLRHDGDPAYTGPVRPEGWTLLGMAVELVDDRLPVEDPTRGGEVDIDLAPIGTHPWVLYPGYGHRPVGYPPAGFPGY